MSLKSIYIAGNGSKVGCAELIEQISLFLKGKAHVVGTCLGIEQKLPEVPIDLVISLGGDGSFLNMVSSVIERDIPIMGVNFGRLGFLTAGLASDVDRLLLSYLEGETQVYDRLVLKVEAHAGDERLTRYALNDVVVCAKDLSNVVSLSVNVSGESLFHFRGDGMIISTPTGSTAHSISAGGSLVHPRVEALLLTPLCSQSMSSRPIIVHSSVRVEVGILPEGSPGEVLYDGKRLVPAKAGDKVTVSRHDRPIKMVQTEKFKFLHRLADKLGWSESF
jgi:NAD+ kinase